MNDCEFETLLQQIDSLYRPKRSYDDLVLGHLVFIGKFRELWVDIQKRYPQEGQRVLALQDLTPTGKGIFVSDYFYENRKFVANREDTDGYGFITHWIAQEDLK